MSVVGGLFSDVFKSQNMAVPGASNTIDWSKAGGNAADLNWDNIKPFQVIPPMSWASTNKDATAPEEAKKQLDGIASTDTRSEYQKWLDSQHQNKGGEGGREKEAGWYERTTPEERAAFFAENPTMAKISDLGMAAWGAINPYGLASAQERMSPGLLSGYRQETSGIAPSAVQNMIQQYSLYNNPDAQAPGGSFAGYAPSPNEAMSVANQYASYGAGRDTSPTGGVSDGSDGRSYGISGGEGE